jgi:DNA-binding transcriptional MocR family regulator
MVTLGAQHAITLLARTLLGRGDRILVETPSYPHAIHALRSEGGRIDALTAVPLDQAGWDLTRFDNALQAARPSLAYLIPDLHNPTGMSMTAETREHVTGQAARFGTILIADETTAELAHSQDSPSPLPLACYSRDERLVVTTFVELFSQQFDRVIDIGQLIRCLFASKEPVQVGLRGRLHQPEPTDAGQLGSLRRGFGHP